MVEFLAPNQVMWVRFLHGLQLKLERATCKEQGLPAKQIVHFMWIGVGIQPLRKDYIKTNGFMV